MKRLFIRTIAFFARLFWKTLQPQTIGVRAIIKKENQFLLVKHSYSECWYLCGGGKKNSETVEEAMRRELKEELGIIAPQLKLHGVYDNSQEGKKDTIIVFSTEINEMINCNDIEIECYDFFNLDNLPTNISPGTLRRIKEFVDENSPNYGKW